MNDCPSCKDDRVIKGLPALERVKLPPEVTSEGFRRPEIPVYVCRFCDGETLVASALRTHQAREDV